MWNYINNTYILVRDRQTGEKQIFKMSDGLKYMVGPISREHYEVEKIFSSEEELATLKILYGSTNKKRGD